MKLNSEALIVVAVVLTIVGFLYNQKHGTPVSNAKIDITIGKNGTIYEKPRTATPMDIYTRLFTKKQFTFNENGKKRAMIYYWFEPKGKPYPPELKFPLVVILHGGTGNAYAAQYAITRDMQINNPAFVFIPMSPLGKVWAVPDVINGQKVSAEITQNQALPDAVEMIRQLTQRFPVDINRIYIVGCSDGGGGAYGAVSRYPNLFAAAVPMSGLWDANDAPKMTTVPMWVFHGALDDGMPVAGTRALVSGIKKYGGNIRYTELPEMGHECPSPILYTKAMWQWLFSQKKAG